MFSDQNPIWFSITELFFIILVLELKFIFIMLKALVLFIEKSGSRMSRLRIILNPLQFIQGLFIQGYLYGSAINMLSSSFLVSRDVTVSCNLRVNIAFITSVLLDVLVF